MYLEMTGQSKEQLLENFLPQAETRIIHDLILEAIREKKVFEVSDEEIDDKITEYMEEYGDGDLDPAAQERMREHYEKNRTGIANLWLVRRL